MTETNKPTLTLGKKLELKKTADNDQVRQSFAHGRSKTVTVEVKRRRSLSDKPQNEDANIEHQDDAGTSKFTKDELNSRIRAVQQALKEPKPEPKADEPAKQNESVVEEAVAQVQEEVSQEPQAQPEVQEIKPEPKVEVKKPQQAQENPYRKPKPSQTTAAKPAPAAQSSEPRIFRADDYLTPKPQPVKAQPAKPQAPVRAKVLDEEEAEERRGKAAKVELAKKVVSVSKREVAYPKKLTGSSLTRALDGEEDRGRSLAALRRARQKQASKQAASNDDSQKIVREVIIPETIVVSELANRMAVRGADVVKALMKLGMLVTVNQAIDADTAELLCTEFGHTPKRVSDSDVEIGLKGSEDDPKDLLPRAPVVTVMGHVDHGKTSLLDALRSTDVVSGEAGGITQHIGAYQVTMKSGKKITFIDTPGHEAFTSMRARGANLTDVVVLVVAADDGVMPQTIEAINHAKAANVPIVVAINKIDKPDAQPDRVKSELIQHGIVTEDFGGDVLCIPVSAKQRMNLEKLEEAILLQAEVLDLKANPNRVAEGVVVESRIDKGRGNVATILVQRGTLKVGDIFVAGKEWGRVRAINDDHGKRINAAEPSTPVEILGFNGAPAAGDEFYVVDNENRAREIAEYRIEKEKNAKIAASAKSGMDSMLSQIAASQLKELAVVIKADVQGSLEAISASLQKLTTDEVKVRILHGAVGGINESDVTLANASKGLVIGFNVRANPQAREFARKEGLDIRYYSIIYDVIDDVKAALGGLLSPTLRENFLGYAEIRNVFNITKVGKVAGCYVTEGTVKRGAKVRLLRDNVVIHEGTLKTLKRIKDEVKEVKSGFECGMAFENYDDIKEGDVIECFEIESIARVL